MRAAATLTALCQFAAASVLVFGPSVEGRGPDVQDVGDLADRPILAIRILGLSRVDEVLVRNQLRTAVGDPYDAATVRGDVRRLDRLGEFKFVTAEAELAADGSVMVIFSLVEQVLIAEVQVVGNKLISDQDLLQVVALRRGLPLDNFLISSAKREIEALYRRRGHYLVNVLVDESELEETGILLLRVIEGPRVKVRAIEFVGVEAFDPKQLRAQIDTHVALPLVRRGELDEEVLIGDVAALDRFYRDRGYLDVRVDRRIDLSPDNKEAKITFLLAEGRPYTLRAVQARRMVDRGPLRVFAPEQIAAMLDIKTGDLYSRDKLRKSLKVIRDAYGHLGYLDVRVSPSELRTGAEPQVDLLLSIDEGRQYKVGLVRLKGNFLTRDKVIRRHLRGVRPGRPFDAPELERATERIRRTRLFNEVRLTVQDPDPAAPEYRDVLVEVKEANTGSVNFGLAVGSDAGVFGEFSIVQRNFDIADLPESLDEWIRGRAFRGGGQQFSMVVRPGNEFFQYSVSITEPNIFETNNALRVGGNFRQRQFDRYDEQRVSLSTSLSRRLGEIWNFGVSSRFEQVELSDIDSFAPTAVFSSAGPDSLASVGLSLTRTSVATLVRPGRGSRLELAINQQTGLLGGDFDFTTTSAAYTVFLTLDEDFLGRRSILKLNSRVGYIINGEDAPIYQRLYLGGRSFRGFGFREVSPKGIRADDGLPSEDPVGGEWLLFAGAQYEFPLFAETITGVFFVDSGTVTNNPGFDDYRVSIGGGIRLYIPQLGPIPMAFDFAVPIRKEDDDETQLFSFTAELPFD